MNSTCDDTVFGLLPGHDTDPDAGQTLTITDERMTRFLLTLNEAIDLVLAVDDPGRA